MSRYEYLGLQERLLRGGGGGVFSCRFANFFFFVGILFCRPPQILFHGAL